MDIINLTDDNHILQTAVLLHEGFKVHWPNSWPDIESAIDEVNDLINNENIVRVAVIENEVVGFIGGIPDYNGNVWELHPLVVKESYRKKGIGKALVIDLEAQVKLKGGLTITLGSDDEDDMTSLSGIDVYNNFLDNIKNIVNFKNHPYEFYQKLGFIITGIVPDANGYGKPDIIMSKRVL